MIRAPVFPRGRNQCGLTFAPLRRGKQRRSGCPSRSRFPQRAPARPSDHRLIRRSLRGGGPVSPEHCVGGSPARSLQPFNALTLQRRNAPRPAVASREGGFTLLELLVVIGIIALLMVLLAPAFTNIKSGTDVTNAAYTIKGVLDTARTYAKANNTYAWVGFYEENSTDATPTNNAPPYPGTGRVLLATVASKDGTKIYEDTDPAAALPPTRITAVGKLVRVEGIHLTDLGNPSPTPSPTPVPDTLLARPYIPYTEGSPFDHYNRISSDSPDSTLFTFAAQNYTFYKTIRFNPRGETNINSTYSLKHLGEIGIKPTHGNVVDSNNLNRVAIQFGGVGGDVKIYRR